MALIKAVKKTVVEPSAVWRKLMKDYRRGYGDTWPDESLTWAVSLDGYPGVGKNDDVDEWWLSQKAIDSQTEVPLRLPLEPNDSSPDVVARQGSEAEGILWLYRGIGYFTTDTDLNARDVQALVNVETNKRRLVLEKAHALQAMSDNYDRPKRRESIPQPVRIEVWQRDGGRCVECESQDKLEFDHIIPLAMGGSNTTRNLQLLCETCNRRKGASLG